MPSEGFVDRAERTNADRLRWQCRRGMLELDFLLNRFMDSGYEGLDSGERELFAHILDFEDQLLLDWIMQHVIPADPRIAGIIDRIRGCRVNK